MFPWGDPPPGVTLTPIQQAIVRVLGPIFAEEIRQQLLAAADAERTEPIQETTTARREVKRGRASDLRALGGREDHEQHTQR